MSSVVTGETPPGAKIYESKCATCHGPDGQGADPRSGADDGYDEPLFGDLSIDALAGLIDRTMPIDDPDACRGNAAKQVARYVYDKFYSQDARLKNGYLALPRIELQRLTVPQYRNAVADLIGHFTPDPSTSRESRRRRKRGRSKPIARQESTADRQASEPAAKQDAGTAANANRVAPSAGLAAEYFQSKGMSKADELKLERVDTRFEFDFGEASPADNINADQFAIIWRGGLRAGDTGYYEFRVETPNGARLYLNNDPSRSRRKLRDDSSVAGQTALIDAWVSSGKMRTRSARVYLIGGRVYPIRLEFFKYLEKTASIRFEWKPPNGAWSVLNHNHTQIDSPPRTFVVDTPFPADDRSLGYERGSSVPRDWHVAATHAAVATADEVISRLPLLAGVDEEPPSNEDEVHERDERLRTFVERFATVAFRRPLTAAEIELCRTTFFEGAENTDSGVRRAIIFLLMSPNFLYPDLASPGEPSDQYRVASRLAFALWDSIPSDELIKAAAQNGLKTTEQIATHARRMLNDPRAHAKMRRFFHHWLEIEERELAKDDELFPNFNESVIADLRFSLDTFIAQVVWSEESDYRQLLLADYLIVNETLRGIYAPSPDDVANPTVTTSNATFTSTRETIAEDNTTGNIQSKPVEITQSASTETGTETESTTSTAADDRFAPQVFVPNRRAGVLTHPYLLSAFAYHNNTSPIHRGVFLTRNIVGRALKPPPVAVAFRDDEFADDLTMREKITQLTHDKACISCHSVINPLGFALENYDAVGRWRTMDNERVVNTTSEYVTVDGTTLEVKNARDIAKYAAESHVAQKAFVNQLFRHLVRQPPLAFGLDTVDKLRDQFAAEDFSVQGLLVNTAVIAARHDAESHSEPPKLSPYMPEPNERD